LYGKIICFLKNSPPPSTFVLAPDPQLEHEKLEFLIFSMMKQNMKNLQTIMCPKWKYKTNKSLPLTRTKNNNELMRWVNVNLIYYVLHVGIDINDGRFAYIYIINVTKKYQTDVNFKTQLHFAKSQKIPYC